ncbi:MULTISPECIES: dTDP-4-dehydrorhamnose reductase [Neptunomonas]|uniref:dTDP-4-dehydrorhamnose reductase n=1 Tax=Neptunomonas marina TaxID=1815562 RepID=A0A437Q5Q4_9GAMM|nr:MULTISPECIES: dTDP-4-dehydrorhamnose reductase [Neptunomonas]RVU29839.1 dTDP-4-dehydrorhamnose reductase [Neptunomonas marina]
MMKEWVDAETITIVVTGGDSQVAQDLVALAAKDKHFKLIALDQAKLDITQPETVRRVIDELMPDYLINTAAFNRVDAAEQNPELCYRVNRDGVKNLADICGELSIPLIHLSTDHVFDGHYASGYAEGDDVSPLGVFGDSKYQGEQLIRQFCSRHIILRVSWVFSDRGDNHLLRTLTKARTASEIEAADDRQGCPTSSADVARVILAMIQQLQNGADSWGTYHYCGAEVTTRYRFTEAILAAARQYEALRAEKIVPVSKTELNSEAERPASSVLKCKKILAHFGIRQRPWRNELPAVMRAIYQPDEATALQDKAS